MATEGNSPEKRTLGKTGEQVSSLGLGAEGLLRTWSRLPEAVELIWRALELGVAFFDAPHNNAGSEDFLGEVWREHPTLRNGVFLCSQSSQRTKLAARRELEMTLRRMHVDQLDLWQLQDVETPDDWEQITGPGGALEAYVQAYQAGLVRYIGITGQHDPSVLERAINEFEFHTISIPVNAAEEKLPGFLDRLLPVAVEKGTGVIGTKVTGGGALTALGIPREPLLRFALSLPISVAIVDCDSVEDLEKDVAAAQLPFTSEDRAALDAIEYDPEEVAYYRGAFKNVNFTEGDL